MSMLERLDRVTIELSRSTVILPWYCRDELLAEMQHVESADITIRAFENAGSSAAVRLHRSDKEVLVEVIDGWISREPDDELPVGISELRSALLDDLHDVPE